MSYNTASIGRLNSFEHAKNWHNRTKPIARNKDGVRPLGDRRHHRMASITMPDPDTVNLMFHDKPLVQWRSDDTFTVNYPTYCSAFAVNNLHSYLPKGHFEWDKGRLFFTRGSEKYQLEKGGKLEFQKVGDAYLMLNKPVAYAYRKQRGVVDKHMRAYIPFLDWLTVVLSSPFVVESDSNWPDLLLEASGLPNRKQFEKAYSFASTNNAYCIDNNIDVYSDMRKAMLAPFDPKERANRVGYGFNRKAGEVLHEWVSGDDPELWVAAASLMAVRMGRQFYNYYTGARKNKLEMAYAVDYLRHLVCYLYREEVFKKERLEDGEASTKRNEEYFVDMEIEHAEWILRQFVVNSEV